MFLVTSLRPNPKPPDEIRDAADAAAAQVDPTPISDLTRMKADASVEGGARRGRTR